MKQYFKINRFELIIAAILLILGLLCLFLSGEAILKIITYAIGIFFIASGITVVVGTIKNRAVVVDDLWIPLVQGVLLIVVGVCLFFFFGYFVRLIIGLLFIIIPTIKIFLHKNKKEIFLKELYKYVIGFIFLISFDSFLNIIFFVIGLLLLLMSIVIVFYTIKLYGKDQTDSLFYKIFIKKLLKEIE